MQRHLLFCSHHELVARTENLIHLRHRLRTVCHSTDSLYATGLEYSVHASYLRSHQYGRIHLAILSRRCAEHYLPASCYLGRSGKHQHGREQRCRTAWDVKAHLLYGNALLPAGNTGGCLYLLAFELLRFVEGGNILMCQYEGLLQFRRHQCLRFCYLVLGNGERFQPYLVKLLFVCLYGLVAVSLYVGQHVSHDAVQLRHIHLRPFAYTRILRLSRIFYVVNIHVLTLNFYLLTINYQRIIFSIGSTRIPSAPFSFS